MGKYGPVGHDGVGLLNGDLSVVLFQILEANYHGFAKKTNPPPPPLDMAYYVEYQKTEMVDNGKSDRTRNNADFTTCKIPANIKLNENIVTAVLVPNCTGSGYDNWE